ncbi:MAG: tetratricopeptide repeat protein [Candidatus Obscuribacterales bacterium]
MTWQSYLNHASQLVTQGKYAEAEQIIYQAFKQARTENDPKKVSTSLDLLSWLAFMQQKYPEAEQIYQYATQVKIQIFGADHIEVGKTIKNIIAACYHQKKYEQVVGYASEALRIYALNYGNDHAECKQLATNLVELLKWLGRVDEADRVRSTYLEVRPEPQYYQGYQQPAQHQQPVQQQPAQQSQYQSYQQPAQQQPAQQQQSHYQSYQQPQQQQPVQQQPVQQQPVQQQPVQQQPVQQQPAQQPQQQSYYQGYQQPAQKPGDGQQAQPGPSQQGIVRKDYSKFAKSVCEVCQMEFEGSECLRCTSGQITVFDPGSRLGNDFS